MHSRSSNDARTIGNSVPASLDNVRDGKHPVRILLVRLRQIGDVVFTTPAVRGVRERYPDARISYLVEPAAAAVVRENPHLDEVIVAPRATGLRRVVEEVRLVRRLRSEHFDLVIDFHGGPRASTLAWLSGAPTRIGYNVVGRGWMYSHCVHRPRGLRARHSVENQWDLLRHLDVSNPCRTRHPVEMLPSRPAVETVGHRLRAAGVSTTDQLIVIHVSAGNPFRRWPLASFATLAAELARADARRRIILTAGPSEADAAARAISDARAILPRSDCERVLDCGEFSLEELRALADRTTLYIGGDSGPMHVVSASRVPVVALYGPTLPARSAPWRDGPPAVAVEVPDLRCRPCDQRVCEPGDYRCLTWIAPARVLEAAERVLASSGKMS